MVLPRKRKKSSAVSSRIVQPGPSRARVIAVHRSQSGRLGQSTSYSALHSKIRRDAAPNQEGPESVAPDDEGSESSVVDADVLPHDVSDHSDWAPDNGAHLEIEIDKDSDSPLVDWMQNHRASYLDEMIRHEGRGGVDACAQCGGDGIYKCRDCFGFQLLCQSCFTGRHSLLPFHRPMQWNGSFFEDIDLKSLGIQLHLGHAGAPCPSPNGMLKAFTVVDTTGIHTVDVVICGCYSTTGGSQTRTQLLRVGLMPATHSRPNTAFTFDVLNSFHLLTLQAKASAYDFYLSLEHKTDNCGLKDHKTRYKQFLGAMRVWRHLKIVKRAGRAHDSQGLEMTQPGACAVECPACPQPGRNLPDGYHNAAPAMRWLYALILTVDANFRLKRKDKRIRNDPALGASWGHWVPETEYQAYLQSHGDQEEPNLCDSDLQAIDHANQKFSQGYQATGVGGTLCARHCLVRKNGLGDLQKGERYANMDFLVFSTLVGVIFTALIISYDIACQWSRNLKQRMSQFPSFMRLPVRVIDSTRFVIPKFHIYGHGQACQTKYSLNYLKNSARTDGEEPERWWAHINPVSMSTREMGPGARQDTIDDHAAAWNWRKITNLGQTMATKMREALRMRQKHSAVFAHFSAKFAPETIKKWTKMITDWDADPCKPDPYEETVTVSTMADVRLELACEEFKNAEHGSVSQTAPHVFLYDGLQLEEQQRMLKWQLRKDSQETVDLQNRRKVLDQRIKKWREVQAVYMPGLPEVSSMEETTPAEDCQLFLPSTRPSHLTSANLRATEAKLRLAQADDTLAELRRLLRILRGLWDYKYTQLGPSQRAGTRARSMISRFKEKIDRCVERYQAAWGALVDLDPEGTWRLRLQQLKKEHVKTLGRGADEMSEGRREISWIWMMRPESGPDDVASEEEMSESFRVDWSKSRARALRWSEEVLLLGEEMRRVLCFFKWKRGWWMKQARQRENAQDNVKEGLQAYAARQGVMLDKMAKKFADEWWGVLAGQGMEIAWPEEYMKGRKCWDVEEDETDDLGDDEEVELEEDIV